MTTEPKKLLLLEDDAGDARLFQMMLVQSAPGEFEVQRVERLADAKRQLASDRFDLILTDLGLPDSTGLTTFRNLRRQAPDVPIVVFSNLDDEATAVKTVQMGAEDYLMKGQTNGTMVVRSIRYAIERSKARPPGDSKSRERARLLAFIGAKGGVGTTTVALNVAAALASQGKSVILAELQSGFGSLSQMLRATPQEDLKDAMELVGDEFDEVALAAKLTTYDANLRVLYGPQRPGDLRPLDAHLVDVLLEALMRMASIVIADLSPYPSAANESALRASSYAVVVAERDPISLGCCRNQLDVIRPWGPTGSRVGAIIVNRASIATPLKLTEIRSLLGCDIVGMIPPAADECAHAQSGGTPLVVTHAHSLAAEALTQAAARLASEYVAGMRIT